MNTEYHDDLFSNASKPAPAAPVEIRLDADQVAPQGSTPAQELGARLRAAREARGMELAACSQVSHLPVRVLQRLEAGDFGRGDDYVFVRGALNSYARLLGVPAAAVDSALRAVAPTDQPALVPTGNALRAPWVRRYGAAATYIILTAMVAVPLVWLGLRGGLDNQITRIAPLDSAPPAKTSTQVAEVKPAARKPAAPQQEPPLLASMTPFSAMQMDAENSSTSATNPASAVSAAPAGHVLNLRVIADSWVEVTDANGKTLESGILHAGDQRSYQSAVPLNVTIGNADGVQVISDGKPLSLVPYRRANVARFKVFDGASSDN
ncbi:MAG TPA: RodZ domain-containing protein [Rhodanobacteraceae bacterium]|nr:RodZ domain-containing protein [Rhodanobacteraceae bacterium]